MKTMATEGWHILNAPGSHSNYAAMAKINPTTFSYESVQQNKRVHWFIYDRLIKNVSKHNDISKEKTRNMETIL